MFSLSANAFVLRHLFSSATLSAQMIIVFLKALESHRKENLLSSVRLSLLERFRQHLKFALDINGKGKVPT